MEDPIVTRVGAPPHRPPLSHRVRRFGLGLLTRTGLPRLCQPLTRGSALVLMLHRFADPDRHVRGFDPHALHAVLAHLRRRRYQLVDLAAVIRGLRGDGPALRRAVAFTIDDGYREQASIAAPMFAAFDCPVTTFVVTGFLDGTDWLWWDQVEFVLTRTRRRDLAVEVHSGRRRYTLGTPQLVHAAQADFTALCKTIPDAARRDAIRALATVAEVTVPSDPPEAYAPMSWDELRRAESGGMTFAPHSVTHPILSRVEAPDLRYEVGTSWDRLRAEARNPVPVFAYPNGYADDFGTREVEALREIDLEGAFTCTTAYATPRRFREPEGPYRLPRFAAPEQLPDLIQLVTGLERLKMILRGDD